MLLGKEQAPMERAAGVEPELLVAADTTACICPYMCSPF
jgi:hypothetical protein